MDSGVLKMEEKRLVYGAVAPPVAPPVEASVVLIELGFPLAGLDGFVGVVCNIRVSELAFTVNLGIPPSTSIAVFCLIFFWGEKQLRPLELGLGLAEFAVLLSTVIEDVFPPRFLLSRGSSEGDGRVLPLPPEPLFAALFPVIFSLCPFTGVLFSEFPLENALGSNKFLTIFKKLYGGFPEPFFSFFFSDTARQNSFYGRYLHIFQTATSIGSSG